MTRYELFAKAAVAAALAGRTAPMTLFDLSCAADAAARRKGKRKRRELYSSLYDYEALVPDGWRTRWLTASGGTGDSMLMVVPAAWQPGSTPSNQLLLGAGPLVLANCQVD